MLFQRCFNLYFPAGTLLMKSWNSLEPTHNTANNKCSGLIINVIISENENENIYIRREI